VLAVGLEIRFNTTFSAREAGQYNMDQSVNAAGWSMLSNGQIFLLLFRLGYRE